MTRQIKIFFLSLLAVNVILGVCVAVFYNIMAGIIAFSLLLLLNAVGYAIILKMSKISEGKNNGTERNDSKSE